MEYECGRCLPSDCRGNPAYFDPDCPVHGKKEEQNILFQKQVRDVEKKIKRVIRQSSNFLNPMDVLEKVDADKNMVRQIITSLIDRGELQVTLDWKLMIRKSTRKA